MIIPNIAEDLGKVGGDCLRRLENENSRCWAIAYDAFNYERMVSSRLFDLFRKTPDFLFSFSQYSKFLFLEFEDLTSR